MPATKIHVHNPAYVEVGAAAAHMLLSEQSPTLYSRETLAYHHMVDADYNPVVHVRPILSSTPSKAGPYRNGVA
jgi:hypothetical protein